MHEFSKGHALPEELTDVDLHVLASAGVCRAVGFLFDDKPPSGGFRIDAGGFTFDEALSSDGEAGGAGANHGAHTAPIESGFTFRADLASDIPQTASEGFQCPNVAVASRDYNAVANWLVGVDCGHWLSRSTPPLAQAKSLIVNATYNLRRVSVNTLKLLAGELGIVLNKVVSSTRGHAYAVAGAIMGVSAWRAHSTFDDARAAKWCIDDQDTSEEGALAVHHANVLASPRAVLRLLTREALSVSVEGCMDVEYLRRVARASMHGLPVGNKYHSSRFLIDVEHLAMQCVRAALAIKLSTLLAGLGKRSRFVIFFDKACIQGGLFSRHEALMIIGIGYVDPDDGTLQSRMIACPSAGKDGDGPSVRDLVLQSLREHPLCIGMRRLRMGLAGAGGDGAVAKGGSAARHRSTKAADLFWDAAHPRAEISMTEWDLFHRLGVADLRAVRDCPFAQEVIDVHKAMNAMFGVGRGRVLLRAVAAEVSHQGGTPGATPVTREGVHVQKNAEDLVKHFVLYHAAMKVRLEVAKEGSGKRNQASLVEIGRRLSSVDFVSFLLICHDTNTACVAPLNLASQRAGEEGPEIERQCGKCVVKLRDASAALSICREWLWISVLIMPYVPLRTVGCLWRALRYRQDWRLLPRFIQAVPELLLQYTFKGCGLLENHHHAAGIDPSQYQLLAGRCQCDTKTVPRGTPGRHRRRFVNYPKKGSPGEVVQVLAPEWVANAATEDPKLSKRMREEDFSWLERAPTLRYRAVEQRPPVRLQGDQRQKLVPLLSG